MMNSELNLTQQEVLDIMYLHHIKKINTSSIAAAYKQNEIELKKLIEELLKRPFYYAETKTNTLYEYQPGQPLKTSYCNFSKL